MLLARHLGRIAADLVRHAVATRSAWVLFVVLLLLAVVAVTGLAQVVAPVVVYPFL